MPLIVAENSVEAADELRSCAADARIIVATDFSMAAVPLTLMRAFVAILGSDADAELVFVVPGDPSDEDANSAQLLLSEVGSAMRGSVRIESFSMASTLPYDVAVVPQGDLGLVLAEVGAAIVRMHVLARREIEGCPGDVNAGTERSLQRRLANYAEIADVAAE